MEEKSACYLGGGDKLTDSCSLLSFPGYNSWIASGEFLPSIVIYLYLEKKTND